MHFIGHAACCARAAYVAVGIHRHHAYCIMVISIVKSLPTNTVNYFIDKALAIDSLLFMISALFSFLSIRLENSNLRFERWAEIIFIVGLVSMTMITMVFSFEIF